MNFRNTKSMFHRECWSCPQETWSISFWPLTSSGTAGTDISISSTFPEKSLGLERWFRRWLHLDGNTSWPQQIKIKIYLYQQRKLVLSGNTSWPQLVEVKVNFIINWSWLSQGETLSGGHSWGWLWFGRYHYGGEHHPNNLSWQSSSLAS